MPHLPLRSKVALLAVAVGLAPVLVMAVLILIGQPRMVREVGRELDVLSRQNVAQITTDVYTLCRSTHRTVTAEVNDTLNRVLRHLERTGGITVTDRRVTWTAVNPATGRERRVELPALAHEGKWFLPGQSDAAGLSLLGEVHRWTGMEFTVFQRMNDEGDMLRVATTVVGPDGRLRLGTVISASGPEGTPDPVIGTVMNGEVYQGGNYTLGRLYLTGYAPLTDDAGRIIGMVGVGQSLGDLEYLKEAIMDITVGDTGYVWVVGGRGDYKYRYIVSQDGQRDGEDLSGVRNSEGVFFVRSMVDRATARPGGEIQFTRYAWQNVGDPEPRHKLVAYTYFPPWGWVIGAGMYEDDYYDARYEVERSTNLLLYEVIAGGVLILILAAVGSWIFGARLTRPITRLTDLAGLVAEGDLDQARDQLDRVRRIDEASNGDEGDLADPDETIRLSAAFGRMIESLRGLIGQVRQSGLEVRGAATEISASARELEGNASNQAASTNQVTAASRDISARAESLATTMGRVREAVTDAASVAGDSRRDLAEMETAMNQLIQATSAINHRLGNISQKADNIGGVVTTIAKVADQTNLLSLNASIEAEKAGEAGLGFAVVAREIRRLADATAGSTADINQMVGQMQSAVSAGIVEMDNFVRQVTDEAEKVSNISAGLSGIIDRVEGLTEHLEAADDAASAQASGADEIREAMSQLSDTAQQTKEALRDFNQAAQQLVQNVMSLQEEVARFNVS